MRVERGFSLGAYSDMVRSKSSHNPLISVVIPAYNRAKTIGYCIDSVLAQTVSPFEVIVVDDCSADATADIAGRYRHAGVRCIVLEKNSGAQAARNRGIKEAKGDWIAFQDSDDEWMPEKLQKQIQALSRVGSNALTVVHTGALRRSHAAARPKRARLPVVEGEYVYPFMLATPGPMFPGMLVSRQALEKIGFLDEKVPAYQEWDTAIRLARICRFIYLREPLFVYHIHEGETISGDTKRDINGYQYVVDKFREDILSECGRGTYNDHIAYNALRAMGWGFFQEAEDIISRHVGSSAGTSLLKLMNRAGRRMPGRGLLVKWANVVRWLRWKLYERGKMAGEAGRRSVLL